MTEQSNPTPDVSERDIEQLSAYIDEQLPPEERAALEERLREDAALRAELDAMQRTVSLIRALEPMRAPRDFTLSTQDVAGIEQEEPPQRIVRPAFRSGWIVGLAAAIVVVLVGILVALPTLTNSGDTAPAALSVADQPSATPQPPTPEQEEAAELDFAAEAPAAEEPAAEAESRAVTTQPTQGVFLTATTLAVIEQTSTPALTAQPTFGGPGIGLTLTASATPMPAATMAAPEADEGAEQADSAQEEGAALGGMAAEADAAEMTPQVDIAEERLDDAPFPFEAEDAPEDDAVGEAAPPMRTLPALELPAPEEVLQFLLRALIVLLQSLYGV